MKNKIPVIDNHKRGNKNPYVSNNLIITVNDFINKYAVTYEKENEVYYCYARVIKIDNVARQWGFFLKKTCEYNSFI
jgi:hypothetical protein